MPMRRKAKRLIYMAGIAAAAVTFPLSYFFAHKFFRSGAYLDDAMMTAIVAGVVIIFMYQRELSARAVAEQKFMDEQRLKAFRATMVTIFDILGNFLNNIQVVRMDAEASLPKKSLALFDHLITEVQVHLNALGGLETLTEKQMAIGMGIQYPLPKAPPDVHLVAKDLRAS